MSDYGNPSNNYFNGDISGFINAYLEEDSDISPIELNKYFNEINDQEELIGPGLDTIRIQPLPDVGIKHHCEEEDITDACKKWKCDTTYNVPIEVSFLH